MSTIAEKRVNPATPARFRQNYAVLWQTNGLGENSRDNKGLIRCSEPPPEASSAHHPRTCEATTRSGGQQSNRSHPEPRAAFPLREQRAWRGWQGSDVDQSEHGGTLTCVMGAVPDAPRSRTPFRWRSRAFPQIPAHLGRRQHQLHLISILPWSPSQMCMSRP